MGDGYTICTQGVGNEVHTHTNQRRLTRLPTGGTVFVGSCFGGCTSMTVTGGATSVDAAVLLTTLLGIPASHLLFFFGSEMGGG